MVNLSPVQRRVYEIIYDLRQAIPPQRPDEWIADLRELESIGRPAVAALLAELETATRDGEQRLLIMALRYIHDPRAVPALIAALPRVAQLSSDFGFYDISDPKLKDFLDDRYWNPNNRPDRKCSAFKRGITECIAALEALTGHSEGHAPMVNGAQTDDPKELARDMKQRTAFAGRWEKWWDEHQSEFVKGADLADLQAARGAGDLVEQVGVVKYGPLFPTGPHVRLSPVRELTIPAQGYWDAKAHIDFDTGRLYMLYEGLSQPTELEEALWFSNAGVDASAGTLYHDAGDGHLADPYCKLTGWGMKAWPIANGRFDTIETQVGAAAQSLDLGRWGPSGNLLPRDLQSGEYRIREYPATFLFITREDGRGILQLVSSEAEGRAVRIRYRMFAGGPSRRPPLADKLVPPAISMPARFAFDAVCEVMLAAPGATKENSALALKSGIVRPQTVDVGKPAFTDAKHLWLRSWAGDLLTVTTPEKTLSGLLTVKTLSGLGGDHMQTLPVSPAAWNNLSADEIPIMLARQNQYARGGGVETFMVPGRYDKPPGTWVFRTRSGDTGMLQLITLGPDSLTLRYKLVQEKASRQTETGTQRLGLDPRPVGL